MDRTTEGILAVALVFGVYAGFASSEGVVDIFVTLFMIAGIIGVVYICSIMKKW